MPLVGNIPNQRVEYSSISGLRVCLKPKTSEKFEVFYMGMILEDRMRDFDNLLAQ